VVLHPAEVGGDEVPEGERPADAVMAGWGVYASAVVISPSHIITTMHQGGGIGTPIHIGEAQYTVARYYPHPQADMRVAYISDGSQPANLSEYVDIYRSSLERTQTAVIAGYGLGRGGVLDADGTVYGYSWGPASDMVLRWGRNTIDTISRAGGDWVTRTLEADFDGEGEGGHVPYETCLADGDSGGGWFVHDGGEWKLVGLNRSTERLEEAWFRSKYSPDLPDPDSIDAVRVSQYADWIDYVVAGPIFGDANVDGEVGIADLSALADNYGVAQYVTNWMHGDFNGDREIGIADLSALADNYGRDIGLVAGPDAPGSGWTVPEPATAALLVPGVAVLGRRRR
jgi:hypothetical protein